MAHMALCHTSVCRVALCRMSVCCVYASHVSYDTMSCGSVHYVVWQYVTTVVCHVAVCHFIVQSHMRSKTLQSMQCSSRTVESYRTVYIAGHHNKIVIVPPDHSMEFIVFWVGFEVNAALHGLCLVY